MIKVFALMALPVLMLTVAKADEVAFDWSTLGLAAPQGSCTVLESTGEWNYKNFDKTLQTPCKVLFVGSTVVWGLSIEPKPSMPYQPAGYEVWKSVFVPMDARAAAIAGTKINVILNILAQVPEIKAKPQVIVLQAGEGMIHNVKYPAADLCEGIDYCVKVLRKKSPGSKILMVGSLPFSRKGPAWDKLAEVNRGLARLADNQTVFFVDFGKDFLTADGSEINLELMPDRANLSAAGYQVYAKNITVELDKLLKK